MSKEKFTPGEWCLRTIEQFAEYGNPTRHILEKKEDGTLGKSIATISKNENDLAIAYLIAAAPDLYNALKDLIGNSREDWQEVNVHKEKIDKALKALKKARGEW